VAAQALTEKRLNDILRQAQELLEMECSTSYDDVMAEDVIALVKEVQTLRMRIRLLEKH
jgi:hypothetical protein